MKTQHFWQPSRIKNDDTGPPAVPPTDLPPVLLLNQGGFLQIAVELNWERLARG